MSDQIERDIARANRAALLIDDELLKECFATLEADYTRFWMATEARDTDARERIWLAMQIVGKVRQHLVTVLNDGVMSRAELEALKAEQASH